MYAAAAAFRDEWQNFHLPDERIIEVAREGERYADERLCRHREKEKERTSLCGCDAQSFHLQRDMDSLAESCIRFSPRYTSMNSGGAEEEEETSASSLKAAGGGAWRERERRTSWARQSHHTANIE